MRQRAQLRPVSCCVIVQLKQRHSQELHVFGHAEHLVSGELQHVQFLAFFRPRDMGGQERVHECLEVGAPPLRERVGDVPVGGGRDVRSWGKLFVQAGLETLDFVVSGVEVVAWAGEEG